MTLDEYIQSAVDRVEKYLSVRAKNIGLDDEVLHSFNGHELHWSDLNALVCAVRVAALSKETP